MRKVIFGAANSVDNYIATQDDAINWLIFSDAVHEIMNTMWKTIDAVVMGRRTYEVAAANGMDGYPGIENYVFSKTLDPADHPKVTIVRDDVAEVVRGLKEREGGDICVMGGAAIARECFRAGLIDELGLNIHPVLLGNGKPFFMDMEEPVDLELIECRELPKGCVVLRYEVKH